jgi:mycothiol synthase
MGSERQPVRSRDYKNRSDLVLMQRLLMEARSRTDDWRYAHVGELLFAFFMVTCHLDPRHHIRLWHDDRGSLVGYAILGEDPSLDWQVLPENEWSGIEAEALEWAETRLEGLRRRDERAWNGKLVAGSRQDNAARIAFLEGHRFRLRGDFSEVNMLRSLEGPMPEAIVPAGYHVRAVAGGEEIARRALAQHEVWAPWPVGDVSDSDYRRLMRLPGYDRHLDVVAVAPDGVIAAYANGWIDPVNRVGDLGPVGALPAFRRRGLARAVLLEGLRRMRAQGIDRVCVSTTHTNCLARRLYESIGFRIVNKYLDYARPD